MINNTFFSHKGIATLLVLFVILLAVIIANAVLIIISSQFRLSHHQVSRIRAFYAVQAGVNYAVEKLRLGQWSTGTYTICGSGCDVNDPDIPYQVNINVGSSGSGINNTRRMTVSVDYTYNAP
jgi:Tfp pilus assembly protein PilX